jgi:hypothetical protein
MQLFKWFPEPNRRFGTPVAVIGHFVILYFVAKEFPGNCAHLDLCDEEDQLMKMATEDEQAEVVIRTIRESAYTGEIGDGKIFIHSLEDAMRIRTGDRGESSL